MNRKNEIESWCFLQSQTTMLCQCSAPGIANEDGAICLCMQHNPIITWCAQLFNTGRRSCFLQLVNGISGIVFWNLFYRQLEAIATSAISFRPHPPKSLYSKTKFSQFMVIYVRHISQNSPDRSGRLQLHSEIVAMHPPIWVWLGCNQDP